MTERTMMLGNILSWQLGGAISLLVVTAACGKADSPAPGVPDAGSSSSSGAGAGGAADMPGSTTAGASPEPEGGDATVAPGERCSTDRDCDDGTFCNGREVCAALPDSDYRVCQVPELGPCVEQYCDEAHRRCDCSAGHADADRDGFKAAGCVVGNERPDCDDTDDTRYPTNAEECDLDDPTHDEDCDSSTFFGHDGDEDHDNYVNSACANFRAYQPSRNPGLERLKDGAGTDCNDDETTGRDFHPGAEELCDGDDNNCNGVPDEVTGAPLVDPKEYFPDFDTDSFGSEVEADILYSRCNRPPPGYVVNSGDCDDSNPHVAPSRAEVCNGIDDDCDGTVDEPLEPGTLMFGEPFDGVTTFECVPKGPHSADWVVSACPEGRRDCDRLYSNACEVPDTTLCNCHRCGNVCSFSCGAGGCEEIRGGSTGVVHTCFLVAAPSSESGSVACAGRNALGQLGTGTNQDSLIARTVPLPEPVTSVASGMHHTCAVGVSGSVYCWGLNDWSQLGAPILAEQSNLPAEVGPFFKVDPMLGPVPLAARQITAGMEFSCALYQEGRAACWGIGDVGQLGNGSSAEDSVEPYSEPSPSAVLLQGEPLVGASQLVAGTTHACALVAGAVFCWGSNSAMQLAVPPGTLALSKAAILVPGLADVTVEEIVAAGAHACARAGGQVWCWGAMDLDYEQHVAPVTLVPLPEEAQALAAGVEYTCALLRSGTITCWGSTAFEIGELALSNVTQVFGGRGEHFCASSVDGSTWCVGPNEWGQLANGARQSAPRVPVQPLFGFQRCSP